MAAVFEDDTIVYKEREKRMWLWNLLLNNERECTSRSWMYYEDMETLINLDDCNTIQCRNMQRITLCKMYLKYLTSGRDARKKCMIVK